MTNNKKILRVLSSQPTMEGAGVKLLRAFGFQQSPLLDPFLLLDHFGSNNPDDYMAGFPWHPHRGIETITYLVNGRVTHSDSLGNSGTIGAGDIQWMTAGSGIVHQEMPESDAPMLGFQLWVNLPRANKMMKPRYRDITKSDIPEVNHPGGAKIKVISGAFEGVRGPVQDLVVDIEYLDIALPPNSKFQHQTKEEYKTFSYIFQGSGFFESQGKNPVKALDLVLFDNGNQLTIETGDSPIRLLLVSGTPINEPVAWRGSIVMNSNEELDLAFREFHQGSFIKHR